MKNQQIKCNFESDSDYSPSEYTEESYSDCTTTSDSSMSDNPADEKQLKRKKKLRNNRPKKMQKLICPDLPLFDISNRETNTIGDLLKICEDYLSFKAENSIDMVLMAFDNDPKVDEYYNVHDQYEQLLGILPELYEFDKLVGLKEIKTKIVDQILFFIQGLQTGEYMHTVLYGEQGCGKTTICQIMAKMYSNLGILSKGTFKVAQREDFIAGYLGQTATKTKELLESCRGGILFIDEAYSLGPSKNDTDSFSKEAIDTLNQFLSENYSDFICIIAGYENNLKENFFDKNPGLDRRFPWKFSVSKYTNSELFDIFKYNFGRKWTLNIKDQSSIIPKFDPKKFRNNGGDCKIIFDRSKIHHGKRIFNNPKDKKFEIIDSDIKNALKDFYESKNKKSNDIPLGIYL